MKAEVYDRFKDYDKDHCWQYEIRQQNLIQDLRFSGVTTQEAKDLRIKDFEFTAIDPTEEKELERTLLILRYLIKETKLARECTEIYNKRLKELVNRRKQIKSVKLEIKFFIQKHEWLGKLPIWPTHRFTARLKKNGVLAGVIVMATPNAWGNLLGEENRDIEKLISRGACISWSPKNLGSWLIMQSIKWMVKNTEFRVFSAYSDPEAQELGTLYQACNFLYLGQNHGGADQYFDPANPNRGWFGGHGFNDRSQIKRYAKKLEIEWQPKWTRQVGTNKKSPTTKINWKEIPEKISTKIKNERTAHRKRCIKRKSPKKHKYIYILGRTKKENKELHKRFKELNEDVVNLSYPIIRGTLPPEAQAIITFIKWLVPKKQKKRGTQ